MTFLTFLSFWSFPRFRPGIGVLGPSRRGSSWEALASLYQTKTQQSHKSHKSQKKVKKKSEKVIKVIKVKKIGCGPCGRPQEGLGKLLGGPCLPLPGRKLKKVKKVKKIIKVIKIIKVKKVIKVKKIGCGPCGRPQEALGRLLGGPRTPIPGAWGLPQGFYDFFEFLEFSEISSWYRCPRGFRREAPRRP